MDYLCIRSRYVMKYSFDYKNERKHHNYIINDTIDTNFTVQIHKKNATGKKSLEA